MILVEGKQIHEFKSDTRRAEVYTHKKGYVVRMFENKVWIEDRVIQDKSESFVEDCAENFILEIF
jgi:hypothetical protein